MTDTPNICPFCGAYSIRSCELEEENGGVCPWEETQPDPDILREDQIERDRLLEEDGGYADD